jgi:hypothetical protein
MEEKTMNIHVLKLFILLLAASLGLAACGDDKKTTPTQLSKPTGLKISEGTLTWNTVQHASKYAVDIGGKEYTAPGATYTLPGLEPGDHQIKVKAKGDGKHYEDSPWSDVYRHTVPPKGFSDPEDTKIDTSWYKDKVTEFFIDTAAQLRGLAAIVNNKPENSEAGAVRGIDPALPADDFLGKTITLIADIDLGGIEISPGSIRISPDGIELDPDDMEIGPGDIDAESDCCTLPVWKGMEFTPIANGTSSELSRNGKIGRPFKGTFDGGLHEIRNIYVPYAPNGVEPTEEYDTKLTNSHGLFGDLGPEGTVRNVILKSGYIRGSRFTGGVVGRNWGQIESSANYATVDANYARGGGGIAGVNYKNDEYDTPRVKNSFNAGLIFKGDSENLGGIVGDINEGIVENCYNIGNGAHKTSSLEKMMGIVGGSRAPGTVRNSYSLAGEGMPTATVNGFTLPGTAILEADYMKSAGFVERLGNAFALDAEGVNGGFPILVVQ